MKLVAAFLTIVTLATPLAYASETKVYVGVITDTMCATDHKPMRVSPDEKCVRDCVGDARTYRYALNDGTGVYALSDQETPAKFAGKKVRVTGTLYPKTKIIKVDAIAPVK